MTDVWITIAVLTVTTALIRASGPVVLGGRDLPRPFQGVISLVAPALLAALIVVETVGAPEGGSLDVDARVLGVGACGGRAPRRGRHAARGGHRRRGHCAAPRNLLGSGPADEITSPGLVTSRVCAHGRTV